MISPICEQDVLGYSGYKQAKFMAQQPKMAAEELNEILDCWILFLFLSSRKLISGIIYWTWTEYFFSSLKDLGGKN